MIFENFDNYIENIRNAYHEQVDKANSAYSQLLEWNRDAEIQKLTKEIRDIRSHCLLPNLSDKEMQAIKDFQNEHYRTCCGNGKFKAKGNHWIYDIGGTGFGHTVVIICPECLKQLDVTDTSNW